MSLLLTQCKRYSLPSISIEYVLEFLNYHIVERPLAEIAILRQAPVLEELPVIVPQPILPLFGPLVEPIANCFHKLLDYVDQVDGHIEKDDENNEPTWMG